MVLPSPSEKTGGRAIYVWVAGNVTNAPPRASIKDDVEKIFTCNDESSAATIVDDLKNLWQILKE
ncbi:MAG: hypothetical protein ACI8R4_002816 [Paracoccaceae bacterium]